jgi:hypothetical protein
MRPYRSNIAFIALVLLLAGCSQKKPTGLDSAPQSDGAGGNGPAPIMAVGVGPTTDRSDLEKVRSADFSVLFVGNSHTYMHDLPGLVGKMIQHLHPGSTVYSHVLGVGFLEDASRNPRCREEIEQRPWKHVVLQAQKVSTSGRFDYSRKEGIDLARQARTRGAAVHFFSEWGLKGDPDNGPRHERIYQEMARAADARVAPVGRAWDLALSERPELALHGSDGNHQSEIGAFLTACVLAGRLSGKSPAPLASFPYPQVNEKDRKFLADAATKAVAM